MLDSGGAAADAYLALLARLPFNLEKVGDHLRLTDASDWFWSQFAVDRYMSNALMLKQVFVWRSLIAPPNSESAPAR